MLEFDEHFQIAAIDIFRNYNSTGCSQHFFQRRYIRRKYGLAGPNNSTNDSHGRR